MATIPAIPRTRIIMDLIKDSEVTTLANYADTELDYIGGAIGIKYADAVLLAYGGVSSDQLAAMSNEDKALRYLDTLKNYHREALRISNVPADVRTYQATQEATRRSEAITDLGDNEYTPP